MQDQSEAGPELNKKALRPLVAQLRMIVGRSPENDFLFSQCPVEKIIAPKIQLLNFDE